MKKRGVLSAVLILLLAVAAGATKHIPLELYEFEKEGSPYFMVQGASGTEAFPLLSTSAKVNVAGMSADTELTQVYKNDGDKTIEAVYVFPLGTKTAIHAMKMRIGDRIVEAEINEKGKARQIYTDAKNSGKTASLLEQQRPNVFQMNVANIMPGDKIEVTVEYSETLVPEDGEYQLVFPTVTGPRYTGEQTTQENWTASPYLHEGKKAPYDFDIEVLLNTPIPVGSVESSSHRIITNVEGKNKVSVKLSPRESEAGNKDFILNYSLQGGMINTGTLLYKDGNEKFFLTMIEPPERVKMSMIPAREYLFVIDVSGSMNGFPLETSKEVMKNIVEELRDTDYFNVLFFAGGSDQMFPKPFPATKANKEKAMQMIMSKTGGGGTQILNAFNKAVNMPKKKGMSRIVVTLTDGYISVEKRVFDLMREKMGKANFFTFGIGTAPNRFLVEGMARVGKGMPFIATDAHDAKVTAKKFVEYIKYPVMTDIQVRYDGFDAYDIEPETVPDLFASRPLVIQGKYKKAKGRIIITGKTPEGDFRKVVDISSDMQSRENEAVKYLWAREKIASLGDYKTVGINVQDEITQLGLKYHLMTDYTSFVAVDKVVRETGEVVVVKQPLPLPEGVKDTAVGYSTGVKVKKQYYNNNNNNYKYKGSGLPPRGGLMQQETSAPVKEYDMVLSDSFEKEEVKKCIKENIARVPVYIVDADLPDGISLDDVESAIFSAIKSELETYFGKKGLKEIEVELKVKNGKVTDVYGVNSELKDMFKKVRFDGITGTITISIGTM